MDLINIVSESNLFLILNFGALQGNLEISEWDIRHAKTAY